MRRVTDYRLEHELSNWIEPSKRKNFHHVLEKYVVELLAIT